MPGGRWIGWDVEAERGVYIWSNGDDYSGAADEADARLIASAPGLLEALKALRDSARAEARNQRGMSTDLLATLDDADLAIAKAEGKQ